MLRRSLETAPDLGVHRGNSVVALRHGIAHGKFSTLSLGRMREYWGGIQKIIDHLEDKLDPV